MSGIMRLSLGRAVNDIIITSIVMQTVVMATALGPVMPEAMWQARTKRAALV